ncbi:MULTISPECIES: dimethylarginine dimethylaminohydrolase family protein [Sporosarcina]|uniref:dimethylarginine dimethylaminohydrolase family protein n=1 Tax=Sporosarcina TaxID=1569 RepID=UPI0009E52DFA|nr:MULTISPECIES: arginine deiminase family protein [Sporosarcina]WJY26955.1 arginine deiminase family protein [Sporosarcina sp. 0.2-SM1T-5]
MNSPLTETAEKEQEAFRPQLPAAKCATEYDTLRRVVLCEPKYMAIEDVINDVQKKYKDENIDRPKAMAQHQAFEKKLREHNVEVIKLPSSERYPEQVFTRDIGFTVGDRLFLADMASDIRKGEEAALQNWLLKENIPFRVSESHVEGGDVIVDRNRVFIGISSRTSEEAVSQLEKSLPDHEVIRVPFDEKYLHLDCVFNVLSPETGLYFPQAFDEDTRQMLESMYDLIEVKESEQFTMGTNVLSIGDGQLFSLPQNPEVNAAMRKKGFDVIEVDFSEIIKSGGSFRCCSMPVVRKD